MKLPVIVGASAAILLIARTADAHFQILYTNDLSRVRGSETTLVMAFSHPVFGGPNMDMSKPRAFYMLSQRGDTGPAKRVDLDEYLERVTWKGVDDHSIGFRARLPRFLTRSLGDYVFVLDPAPYYEAEEDKYIQQFTKTVMNIGGIPGNWAETLDLPAEIRPLGKPYANWTGGIFRGIVLGNGKPVPYAEIEVEYINYPIDIESPGYGKKPHVVLPQLSYGNQSIRANASGEFSVALPRAGWWGICALDIGPIDKYEGKPLSQDAVLWLEVKDVPSAEAAD